MITIITTDYLISSVGRRRLAFITHQLESLDSAHGFSRFLIEDSEWTWKAFLMLSILTLLPNFVEIGALRRETD